PNPLEAPVTTMTLPSIDKTPCPRPLRALVHRPVTGSREMARNRIGQLASPGGQRMPASRTARPGNLFQGELKVMGRGAAQVHSREPCGADGACLCRVWRKPSEGDTEQFVR